MVVLMMNVIHFPPTQMSYFHPQQSPRNHHPELYGYLVLCNFWGKMRERENRTMSKYFIELNIKIRW